MRRRPDARCSPEQREDPRPRRRRGAHAGHGPGARAGEGMRHLRQRPPLRQARRVDDGARLGDVGFDDGRVRSRQPARPERRHLHGSRVLGRAARPRSDTQSDLKPGALVTALPVLMGMGGIGPIVYSNKTKGGYGERMLLTAPLLLEVPNGLRPEIAALTEPMAVGLHGVNKGNLQQGEGALVLGCGPVGLAVIAALKVKGVGPIVAADFSPARRELAVKMGAHEAVDPREESAWKAWTRAGNGRPPVIFEAIGVPGIINDIMRSAPGGARVVVVGVCMENDTINPFFGISKELNIQFALGYDPMEFAGSLKSLAEGEIDGGAIVTAEVGLDKMAWAFDALGNPEEHCKIIVTP